MTKDELLRIADPIIAKIAKTRKTQKFAYYEGVDIEQEVWVFCLQALGRYDPDKASGDISIEKRIEHFLNNHVTNRIKNLMRDKYFRPENKTVPKFGNSRTRMDLVNALPLDICDANNIEKILGSGANYNDPVSSLLAKETIHLILSKLPSELIDPFESIIGGNKVRKGIEMYLQEEVARILQELDDE